MVEFAFDHLLCRSDESWDPNFDAIDDTPYLFSRVDDRSRGV